LGGTGFAFHKEGETASKVANLIVMQNAKPMRRRRTFAVWALTIAGWFTLTAGASTLKAGTPQTVTQQRIPGHSSSLLKVGDRIPAFRGVDQFGKERDFADVRGPNGLVMLFFRSADW